MVDEEATHGPDGSTEAEDGSPSEVGPSDSPAPKRRGRPPGSKNKAKDTEPKSAEKAKAKPGRRQFRQSRAGTVCSVHGQVCPGHEKRKG